VIIVGRHVDSDRSGRRGAVCSPVLEQLEPRLLLNGVTLITHGHIGAVDGWVDGMADVIANRFGGDLAEYTLVLEENGDDEPDSRTLIPADPAKTFDTVASGQSVIKVDWSSMTSGLLDFKTSTIDVGRFVADWMIEQNYFAEMPIHLIGHSRGASVNSVIAKRLAESGIWVDHITALDPHPLDGESDLIDADDSPIYTYDNVRFADNYWRDGSYPAGQFVTGAYNKQLRESFLTSSGVGYSGSHSDVHLWYHGTIDIDGGIDDYEESVNAVDIVDWYNAANNMPSPREGVGYYYSLIGGGDRTQRGDGLASATNRIQVARSGGQWANLDGSLLLGGLEVPQGGDIPVTYQYQATGDCDISFGFDVDRNPYNASAPSYSGTITKGATSDGTVFDDGVVDSADVNTAAIAPGTYYLLARIVDDGLARYVYSADQVTITPAVGSDVSVSARHLFYNNSNFDGYDPLAGEADDNAIDPGKQALLPGQPITEGNYSGYSRGINGIMIDIVALDAEYAPDIGDFDVRVNESPDTNAWMNIPAGGVDIRRGAGVDGSDRITLVWSDGEIRNRWIEVTAKSDANGGALGLGADDLFYFASVVGDCDGDGTVGVGDIDQLSQQFGRGGASGALSADLDLSGHVGLGDFVILRAAFGDSVSTPTFPVSVPPTPISSSDEIPVNQNSDAPFVAEVLAPSFDLLIEASITSKAPESPETSVVDDRRDLELLDNDSDAEQWGDNLLMDILDESALLLLL
jgi:hypothetical protein